MVILLANGSFLKSVDIVVLNGCNFIANTKFLGEEVSSNAKMGMKIARTFHTFTLLLIYFNFLVALALLSIWSEKVASDFICGS